MSELEAGQAALARGDWPAARATFERVLAAGEDAAALEGLGRADWWLEDLDSTFKVRERAFQLYRQSNDARAAARVATHLAIDYVEFQGELAVATGWLQRAESLLSGLDPCPELGWLRAYQAVFMIEAGESAEAARFCAEAKALGRSLAIFDLEMLATAFEGYMIVRAGRVREGMQLMDEATTAALAGEVHDLSAAGGACCSLIYACESVADYERAAQWTSRAKEFCGRWGLKSFFSICRVYYANVLILRGEWAAAESELEAVTGTLMLTRPATAHEAIGRLGELRRRQGRIEEAEALFDRTDPNPMGLLGRARLALDSTDADTAADLVARFLRRISDEDRAERCAALSILLHAQLLQNGLDEALRTLTEIEALAAMTETPLLLATAARCRGALAAGRGELEAARTALEDAVDLYQRAGAPFETAQARVDLGRLLDQLERTPSARRELRLAHETFRTLGARLEATRALALLRRIDPDVPASPAANDAGLSRREAEVLGFLAAGKSNQEIADQLVLSIRTVERHISSIYEKLNLQGTGARAGAAAFALNRGLTS